MARPRDTWTIDMFRDPVPEPVVARFGADEVRAWSLNARLSLAVARTLDADKRGREEIAREMSELLKENISKATLDAYASQAKESHSIPAVRLAALIAVTRDPRAINALLDDIGLIVVDRKYEALLRRERAREAAIRANREADAADAEWRANQ